MRGLRTFFGLPLTIRTSTSGSSFTAPGNRTKSHYCGDFERNMSRFCHPCMKKKMKSCIRFFLNTSFSPNSAVDSYRRSTVQFVQKSCSTKIATAATTPDFKEIPPALPTYNFGQSVPQPRSKTEIYRCLSCSLEAPLHPSLTICAETPVSDFFVYPLFG